LPAVFVDEDVVAADAIRLGHEIGVEVLELMAVARKELRAMAVELDHLDLDVGCIGGRTHHDPRGSRNSRSTRRTVEGGGVKGPGVIATAEEDGQGHSESDSQAQVKQD
jgi:hypothetical protein